MVIAQLTVLLLDLETCQHGVFIDFTAKLFMESWAYLPSKLIVFSWAFLPLAGSPVIQLKHSSKGSSKRRSYLSIRRLFGAGILKNTSKFLSTTLVQAF